jgi:hypothetical protein
LRVPTKLFELTLADGCLTPAAAGVGRQPHDAAQTAGGSIVVTNELGGGVVFVRSGTVLESLPTAPVQPGGVAAGAITPRWPMCRETGYGYTTGRLATR